MKSEGVGKRPIVVPNQLQSEDPATVQLGDPDPRKNWHRTPLPPMAAPKVSTEPSTLIASRPSFPRPPEAPINWRQEMVAHGLAPEALSSAVVVLQEIERLTLDNATEWPLATLVALYASKPPNRGTAEALATAFEYALLPSLSCEVQPDCARAVYACLGLSEKSVEVVRTGTGISFGGHEIPLSGSSSDNDPTQFSVTPRRASNLVALAEATVLFPNAFVEVYDDHDRDIDRTLSERQRMLGRSCFRIDMSLLQSTVGGSPFNRWLEEQKDSPVDIVICDSGQPPPENLEENLSLLTELLTEHGVEATSFLLRFNDSPLPSPAPGMEVVRPPLRLLSDLPYSSRVPEIAAIVEQQAGVDRDSALTIAEFHVIAKRLRHQGWLRSQGGPLVLTHAIEAGRCVASNGSSVRDSLELVYGPDCADHDSDGLSRLLERLCP